MNHKLCIFVVEVTCEEDFYVPVYPVYPPDSQPTFTHVIAISESFVMLFLS